MADQNTSLPVRTDGDLTEKLQVRILDGTTDAQKLSINADGEAKVEVHGDSPLGADKVLRLSELGAPNGDGVYDVTNNTKPNHSGLIAAQRTASPADADMIKRPTAITSGTTHALDISLHDELGVPYSDTNPLQVVVIESQGVEVNDYKKATAIAGAATDNHDYTVTAATTMKLTQIEAAASGKLKIEVMIETAVASGIFTSKFVKFNSTASPNISIILKEPIDVLAGVKIRVAATNLDNQAQDLYSTISGHEVS